MNVAKDSGNKVDTKALARQINRIPRSVDKRMARLSINEPLLKQNLFSLVEDQCILESLVVTRLATMKLSEVLPRKTDSDFVELSRVLHKISGRRKTCRFWVFFGIVWYKIRRGRA